MQINLICVERVSRVRSVNWSIRRADACTRRAILAFILGPAVLDPTKAELYLYILGVTNSARFCAARPVRRWQPLCNSISMLTLRLHQRCRRSGNLHFSATHCQL
jgi:hypothetical protein